jgi:hypothetical protein
VPGTTAGALIPGQYCRVTSARALTSGITARQLLQGTSSKALLPGTNAMLLHTVAGTAARPLLQGH